MKKRILLIIAIIILLAFTGLFFYNFKNFSTAGIIVKDFLLRVRQVNDLKRDILMSGQVPVSQNGLEHYSQGGVVFNGIGYFTGNWKDREKGEFYRKSRNFPYVVSFDVQTFQKIRTYAFEDTYDSTPLVLKSSDGRKLVLAHEHLSARTKAVYANTGNIAWVSAENQPGAYFFGYSFYQRPEGGKTVLAPSGNGLHALDLKSGQEMWQVEAETTGAITPAVDQEAGKVYYQVDGSVYKIDALSGNVENQKDVPPPMAVFPGTQSWSKDLMSKIMLSHTGTANPNGIQPSGSMIQI